MLLNFLQIKVDTICFYDVAVIKISHHILKPNTGAGNLQFTSSAVSGDKYNNFPFVLKNEYEYKYRLQDKKQNIIDHFSTRTLL